MICFILADCQMWLPGRIAVAYNGILLPGEGRTHIYSVLTIKEESSKRCLTRFKCPLSHNSIHITMSSSGAALRSFSTTLCFHIALCDKIAAYRFVTASLKCLYCDIALACWIYESLIEIMG